MNTYCLIAKVKGRDLATSLSQRVYYLSWKEQELKTKSIEIRENGWIKIHLKYSHSFIDLTYITL